MGNRYVWQGGQTENQGGGKLKKILLTPIMPEHLIGLTARAGIDNVGSWARQGRPRPPLAGQ